MKARSYLMSVTRLRMRPGLLDVGYKRVSSACLPACLLHGIKPLLVYRTVEREG